jgi:hypothetical protein
MGVWKLSLLLRADIPLMRHDLPNSKFQIIPNPKSEIRNPQFQKGRNG